MSWNHILRKALTMYIVTAICLVGSVLAQTTVYVDGSAATTGDGTQAAPFKTIGEALGSDRTVLVAGGTYADESPDMAIASGLTLIGSYDSSFTTSDPSLTPTVIDMARLTQQEQDRTFRARGTSSWTIENLVIQNSTSGEFGDTDNGGAIYVQNGSQGIIRGVTFFQCATKFEGGFESGPAREGGAVCIRDGSTVVLEDCVFDSCTAVGGGGALRMRNAGAGNNVKLYRCLFTNCGARNNGSVIDDGDGVSQVEIVNCIFANNGVDVDIPSGTAPSHYLIRVADRRALIYNCTFAGNNNPDGYMFNIGNSSDAAATKEIVNCIFANNAIASDASVFAIFNYGSGYDDATRLQNNLFSSNSGLDPLDPNGAGIIGANGNIAGDPLFTDAASGDYHLDANSPGVDAGQTLALVPDDFAGMPRPVGPAYDIGALEGQPLPPSYNVRNIVATASSSYNADSGPEKTVDASGLDALDQHDTTAANMWLSAVGQEPPVWIQYEFDRVYKLDQMLVWNANNELEPLVGLGVKTATIEYSTDDTTWTELTDVPEFARAAGTADYVAETVVDFNGVAAQSVKMTITSNWGGLAQYGLSEVRFVYIPVTARDPHPANGAARVAPDVTLSWTEGQEAASHEIHLDTDMQAVTDSMAPVATVSEPTYAPAHLQLNTTYYWKVVEVNEAESPSAWDGPVWSFSTSQHLVVDDFESYSGDEGQEIFSSWIDGYNDSSNGSQVGHDLPPYVERSVIHSGGKSMPLYYGMGGASHSEASRTLDPAQDWTSAGANTLTLYVRGQAGNGAGQFNVKVNGIAKTVAVDFTAESWQEVNVDLVGLGVDLQHVTSLAVSIEGAVSGMVLIDDIRLRP
ncbi:MAG: discoidin domain-containing protein [Sedimentisphaerales bacterium]|nr:discoidin domain-containing protein [Sedimentisphaerales bacterium]